MSIEERFDQENWHDIELARFEDEWLTDLFEQFEEI